MSNSIAYSPESIFTGHKWLDEHSVIVSEKGIIEDIIPSDLVADDISEQHLKGWLVPSFIDIQIYGAHEKLFSVFPEPDALSRLNDYCRSGGAVYSVPTIATNTYEVFKKGIDAIREYWTQDGKGILGLHIEGPWINKKKKGAHIEEYIHVPTISQVKELLEYGKGVIIMITLAPELCDKEIVDLIHSYGVIVSAGHSDASYEQAIDGFNNKKISTCTHMFNAMSPLQHRAPGLAGAILDHDKVYCSIIPDGHHVDFAAVRIATKIMGDRAFVITDAVTTTPTGPYQHVLVGDKYESYGILSGSALKMDKAVYNLINYCGVSPEQALRMCSMFPARAIKKENEIGEIAKGRKAQMTLLNERYETIKIID